MTTTHDPEKSAFPLSSTGAVTFAAEDEKSTTEYESDDLGYEYAFWEHDRGSSVGEEEGGGGKNGPMGRFARLTRRLGGWGVEARGMCYVYISALSF